MMRGLAEYVMTGRRQAIIAVMLLGLIPLVNLLNPAVVGLIALRKGLQEVVVIFAWAILPLGAWAVAGDVVPLIMLIGITGLAVLLRETESWEFTLLAAIAVGVCVEVYFRLQPAVIDALMQQLDLYLQASNPQGLQIEEVRDVMLSVIGAVYMFLSIVLLMLARWMQAVLYNPGGFKQEFHNLRVEQKVALALIVIMLLSSLGIVVPEAWVLYFVLPLLFSGIALTHAVVAKKKLSSMWLVTFYILLMLPVVVQILVLLALVDSWYDFRSRLSSSV
ncbi:MAG: hypothetical protein CBD23_007390 [Gammaproteobacteria bacterium TMED163]|nr:MAG: hypothetical protein CBD23_007390 [Gammaproteobacteria bacterium TMED163]|tara:strand:+ start:3955 stop:4785 length:831 start_codon:yes stop_codon:yes gene_type:complete